MKKLGAALLILLGLTYAASAQRVQAPGHVAIVCAYNSSTPTLTSGWFGYVQCDNKGQLLISGGGGGGGSVTQGTVPWIVDVATSGNNLYTAITSPIPDCGSLPCTNKIGVLAPLTATSTQTKVTITTGSTYQQYLASNTARKGCTIQFAQANTSTHIGYVFFGSAPADTTTSFALTPGQSIACTNSNGLVLTDAIQLTSSNNSDVFVVNSF